VKHLRDKTIVENEITAPKKRRPMLFIFTVLVFFVIYKFSLLNYFGFVSYSDAKNIIRDFEKNYLYNEVFFNKEYIELKNNILKPPFTSKQKIDTLIKLSRQLSGDNYTNFSYADLMRGKIKYSLYKKNEIQSKKIDEKTGYVKLSSFGENAEKKFFKAVEKMEGIEYLILDLRDNHLGYYTEAIEIADDLLSGGLEIAAIESSNSRHYYSSDDFSYGFKKIFLLLDEGSACNTEMFALALKENMGDKVELIGKKTKGMDIGQVYKTYYNKINFSISAYRWNVKGKASESLASYLSKYNNIALSSLEDYIKAAASMK